MSQPIDLHIRPRRLASALPDPLPRHWHGGNAFRSHLFNAMSVLFPDGERFFIESVRLFRDQVTDTRLKEDIRGFIGQEGHHSREHLEYSQRLRDLGYDIDYLERGVQWRLAFVQRNLPDRLQLAVTCAVEHLTAIMANGLLSNPDWLDGADPRLARLWRWHALEETEHKAVAFDLYMQVCGSPWLRRRAMLQSTLFFTWDTLKGLIHMLRRDGLLWNWRVWREGLGWLWGRRGIFRALVRDYLDFYRRDFHPWQHDNRALMARYQEEFAGEVLARG